MSVSPVGRAIPSTLADIVGGTPMVHLKRVAPDCGAANNVLAGDALAERLHENGVLYAPDFIANAGGLIHVYSDLRGHDPAEVDELVDSIGATVGTVLDASRHSGRTPLSEARALAEARLVAGTAVEAP